MVKAFQIVWNRLPVRVCSSIESCERGVTFAFSQLGWHLLPASQRTFVAAPAGDAFHVVVQPTGGIDINVFLLCACLLVCFFPRSLHSFFVRLFVCLLACLFACLLACLFVRLFVCSFVMFVCVYAC